MTNNSCHSYCVISIMCLAMAFSLSLYSCTDRLGGIHEEESFTIEQAKDYFEDNSQGLSLVEYLQPATKSMVPSRYENIAPDWENAKVIIGNGVVTIAANLIDPKMYRATLQLTAGKKKVATEDGVSFSSFLVIQKNTITEKIYRYVVTLVGHNNTGSSVFLEENTDFRGIMLFSTETGRCFRAYEVNKSHYHKLYMHTDTSSNATGENRMAIKYGFSLTSHIYTRGGGGGGYATGEENDTYCFVCGQFSNFDSGRCSYCEAPSKDDEAYAFFYVLCPICGRIEERCICHDPNEQNFPPEPCPNCNDRTCDGSCLPGGPPYDDGDPDEPGNNPGNPNTSSDGSLDLGTYHVHQQGEYLIPNVYDNYPTQLDNCCIAYALNYISEIIGKIVRVEDILLYCYETYSAITTDNELTYSQTMDLFNRYFYTTDEDSIIAALNSRYPVLGIIRNGETDLRYVAIVGYNPDYKLIAMDPANGRLTDIDSDRITDYVIATEVK